MRESSELLAARGLDGREAEILLMDTLSIGRTELYRDDPPVPEAAEREFLARLGRRLKREPLQYITGGVDFLDLRLAVGPGVLVPRPETEWWLEDLISWWNSKRDYGPRQILDMCTGSGCLALGLALNYPDASVLGVDISARALDFARRNAESNSIGNVFFIRSDLFSGINPAALSLDIFVANPPYVTSMEYDKLEPEVRCWEPLEALDAGSDGLLYYRRIIPRLKGLMAPGGVAAFEVGAGQGGHVADLLEAAGLSQVRVIKDLAGHDRMVISTSNR